MDCTPIGEVPDVPEDGRRGNPCYTQRGWLPRDVGRSATVQFERGPVPPACDPSNNGNTIETNRAHQDSAKDQQECLCERSGTSR